MQNFLSDLRRYLVRGWAVVICAALLWGALFAGFALLLPMMLWLIAGIGWALLPIATFMVYSLSLGTYAWLFGNAFYWLVYRRYETNERKSVEQKYDSTAAEKYTSQQDYIDDFLSQMDDTEREYIRQKLAGERLRLSDDGELVRTDEYASDAQSKTTRESQIS